MLEGIADRADRLVIRRHAVANEAERHWQPVDHRDLDRHLGLLAECLCRIDARRARTDDRDHVRAPGDGHRLSIHETARAAALSGRCQCRSTALTQPATAGSAKTPRLEPPRPRRVRRPRLACSAPASPASAAGSGRLWLRGCRRPPRPAAGGRRERPCPLALALDRHVVQLRHGRGRRALRAERLEQPGADPLLSSAPGRGLSPRQPGAGCGRGPGTRQAAQQQLPIAGQHHVDEVDHDDAADVASRSWRTISCGLEIVARDGCSRLPPVPVNLPVFTSITVIASVLSMISELPDGRNTLRSRPLAICSSSRYSVKRS